MKAQDRRQNPPAVLEINFDKWYGVRLQYLISFKETNLVVKIEEIGSRRILYWDTLSALSAPEDKEALLLFKKILTRFSRNLETLSFSQVEIPASEVFDAMRLLSKTKRVVYNRAPLLCDWQTAAKVFWQGDPLHHFSAWIEHRSEAIPLEACERIFPEWCLWKGNAFPIENPLSWKWIELFRKGPLQLEGVQKKRFLEEDPPIRWIKDEALPRLLLTDATGSFANLSRENPEWEKDLFEAGYLSKTVGSSRYFCPGDKVRGRPSPSSRCWMGGDSIRWKKALSTNENRVGFTGGRRYGSCQGKSALSG